jgi:hypothetical protein
MDYSDVFLIPKANTAAFRAIVRANGSCFAVLHLHKPEPLLMRILITGEKQFWLRPVLQRDLLALQVKQQTSVVKVNIVVTIVKFPMVGGNSRFTIFESNLALCVRLPISVRSLNALVVDFVAEQRPVAKPKKRHCVEVIAEPLLKVS